MTSFVFGGRGGGGVILRLPSLWGSSFSFISIISSKELQQFISTLYFDGSWIRTYLMIFDRSSEKSQFCYSISGKTCLYELNSFGHGLSSKLNHLESSSTGRDLLYMFRSTRAKIGMFQPSRSKLSMFWLCLARKHILTKFDKKMFRSSSREEVRLTNEKSSRNERPWILMDYNGFPRQKLSIITH